MKRRVLVVGWFVPLAFLGMGAVEEAPLKLIVTLSKQQVRLGEPLTIAVKLKNISGKNISLFRYLRWGYSGGLTMLYSTGVVNTSMPWNMTMTR